MLLFNVVAACCSPMRSLRLQGVLPLNPQGLPGSAPHGRVQHRGQLHHQHQLAELCRAKSTHVEPQPDAGADDPQFPVGGDRHRARLRAVPRLRAARGDDDRQFLGRHDARSRSTCCCRSAIVYALYPDRQRRAADAAPARSTRPRWKARSRRSRSARSPARKRSRCSAPTVAASSTPIRAHPFENPTALTNLVQMLSIFAIGVGPDLDVRQGGRQHAAGLGDPRRDD